MSYPPLERIETFSVSLNLAVIGALLFGLAVYNIGLAATGSWAWPDVESTIDLRDIRVLLGLLIVVQGFETSRYLGAEHPAAERIKTMRWAQMLSALVYVSFIGMCTVLFSAGIGTSVADITKMILPVAVVLPVMVTVAAVGSQLSAAVADNAGAGGLITDITHDRLPIKYAYLLILIVTVSLTWETHVNLIISYASRAFALYYFLQSIVAVLVVNGDAGVHHKPLRLGGYSVVALLCFLVFVFGLPSE